MYSHLHVLTLRNGDREAFAAELRAATASLDRIAGELIAPTLPGVYNGGDVLVRLTFADAASSEEAFKSAEGNRLAALLADPRIGHDDHVTFEGGSSGGASDGTGLYRVALFCANVRSDAERLGAFRDQTASMPNYVRTIRRWQVSDVITAGGTRPWTHVWEQEYHSLGGLNGAYMLHPIHRAHVERWFDTEYPEHLVDPMLVHTFCDFDAPVIR